MDLGTSVMKYCLCVFNFVFVVVGGSTLGLGVWLAVDQSSVGTLSKVADQETIKKYTSATLTEQLGWFCIALGALIFIISFLGYCGTMKESRVLLGMYSFFLVLIFVLEIILVILFFVYRSEMENETRSVLTANLQKFYSSGDHINSFTVNMDYTMAHGRCCGIYNYTDFDRAEMFQKSKALGQRVPVACCRLRWNVLELKPQDPTCINSPNARNSYYLRGCLESTIQSISQKVNIAIIVGIVVALLQITAIVFAICVYKAAYYNYK